MTTDKNKHLIQFGFSFKKGSVHTKRTMMLNELQMTFDYIDEIDADSSQYEKAIIDENCTRKRSGATRKYTASYLKDLYMLDTEHVLFRALRYFWTREESGRPLIAFLAAYSRDSLLRLLTPYILDLEIDQISSKDVLEEYIEKKYPDRFSPVMKASLGRNLRSTWTQSGHLTGHRKKIRSKAKATPGVVSYALLLGYLSGARGELLFKTEYIKMLDCSVEKSIELAQAASRSGWIVFKKVGNVIEVLFPNLLTAEEVGLIREQN